MLIELRLFSLIVVFYSTLELNRTESICNIIEFWISISGCRNL